MPINRPHHKLTAFLSRQPMGSEITWCDYWRGFWDGTRSLRKNPGILLSWKEDRREYTNGLAIGEKAYKTTKGAGAS